MSRSQGIWHPTKNNLLLFVGYIILAFSIAACRGSSDEPPVTESASIVLPTAGQESNSQLEGDSEQGAALYAACSGCHGTAGEGVDGVGVALTSNDFISTHSDRELVEFIRQGRAADAPDNRSGLIMPPSGGNLSLSKQNLYDIVAFLRMLERDNK